MFLCFLSKPDVTIPLCYSVFKTYVIEKYVFLSFRLKSMLLCLQSPCSSVSHKSPTPLGAPLSVGEGLGVRPYHGSERTKLIH